MRFMVSAALCAAMFGASGAQAAVISKTVTVIATDFYKFVNGGRSTKVSEFRFVFDLTFDDTIATTNSSAGLTVKSINIDVGTPIVYDYETTYHSLIIGGRADGANAVTNTKKDFYVQIFPFAREPVYFNDVVYADKKNSWQANSVTVTYADPAAAVPEPQAWTLLIAGFVAVGAALRKRPRRLRSDRRTPAFRPA